ncbi:hypothetical protein IW262DRAFT_1298889 [Armillaria fumosa]|nr:hypothetical protein IW262DRAFT_1298889 [Armillaria fumosa]
MSGPLASVDKGISLSLSDNLICRDWKGCGTDSPFDKEHLLAFISWRLSNSQLKFPVFQGSQHEYIQYEPDSMFSQQFSNDKPVLFHVDTGIIAEVPPASISSILPDLPLCHSSVIMQDRPHDGIQSIDTKTETAFIFIANTQTFCCDNYMFPAWSSTLKVESGTAGSKKWIPLNGWEDVNAELVAMEDTSSSWADIKDLKFAVTNDESRLFTWTVATQYYYKSGKH